MHEGKYNKIMILLPTAEPGTTYSNTRLENPEDSYQTLALKFTQSTEREAIA